MYKNVVLKFKANKILFIKQVLSYNYMYSRLFVKKWNYGTPN